MVGLNFHKTARDLAVAWIACDQWGDPACSVAYQEFFLAEDGRCPEELADRLLMGRTDLLLVRAYAARLVGQTRRAYSFDLMPARQTWPQTQEDGA